LLVCPALFYPAAGLPSETSLIGGPGGDIRVRMECSPGAYVTGFSASGGIYFSGDVNVLRRLRFTCTGFTAGAQGSVPPGVEPRHGIGLETSTSVRCPDGEALFRISAHTGAFVDSIVAAGCRTRSGWDSAPIEVRVGGSGGSYHGLACPAGEALYRIDARAGNAVDSLKGYCRRFPPQEVDPNAPVFDEAPAQGTIVTLSATNGGEIALRAHGVMAPVTLELQVVSPYASRFALVAARSTSGVGDVALSTAPLATLSSGTSMSRVLRISGPVVVNPVTGSPAVPVAVTARDGAGRTTKRSFTVYLR